MTETANMVLMIYSIEIILLCNCMHCFLSSFQAHDDISDSESDDELNLRLEESDEEMILKKPLHTYGK